MDIKEFVNFMESILQHAGSKNYKEFTERHEIGMLIYFNNKQSDNQ